MRINEVLPRSSDSRRDLIELYNATDQDIDIGYWYIGDSDTEVDRQVQLTRYRIAPGTVVPARGYVVLSREQNFANPADPGVNYPLALSDYGDSVHLMHLIAADQNGFLTGYSDSVRFYGSQTDVSHARYATAAGDSVFLPADRPTIGAANAEALVGSVVIDQVMSTLRQVRQGSDPVFVFYWAVSASFHLVTQPGGSPHGVQVGGLDFGDSRDALIRTARPTRVARPSYAAQARRLRPD